MRLVVQQAVLFAATATVVLMQLQGAAAAAAPAAVAEINCTRSCGNISIEYPFGVEPGCYYPGFNLVCFRSNDSHHHPPLLMLIGPDGVGMPVIDISIPNATVLVNSSRMALGHDDKPVAWASGGQPFVMSSSWRNKIALVACDAQVILLGVESGSNKRRLVSSCTTVCPWIDDGDDGTVYVFSDCSGIGCCESKIVVGYSSYEIQLHQLEQRRRPKNVSEPQVYLVEQDTNITDIISTNKGYLPGQLPVVLDWGIISNSTCPSPSSPANASAPECRSAHSVCQDYYQGFDQHPVGYRCFCSEGYQGNPYVLGGCHDINECTSPDYHCYGHCENTEGGFRCDCPSGFTGDASIPTGCTDIDECANPEAQSCYGICINMSGTFKCHCQEGTSGDPFIKGGCIKIKHSISGLSIGLIVSGGITFFTLALSTPFIIHKIKAHNVKKMKERFFKQNHGLLLQQLMSQKVDIGQRMIMTLQELERATDNFDKTREVGGGGHGIVYKGILDLHVVAIKKSRIVVQREIDDFINEVAILSQVNHRNVVKLLGCCLETQVPLLVYEFISNGSLDYHLHVDGPVSLPWDERIRISLEIARALAYLHSATTIPIFHRDIKASNILLDDNLMAKISDFGASRYIPIDQTGVTTVVQGTIGYLDPMYYYTGRLTDKSDVFSFGVLLIELLTRKKPIYKTDGGDSLVLHFASLLRDGNLIEIVDPQVSEEEEGEVQEVAALAAMCTKLNGEDRPTMREVERTLENLHVKKKFASHNTRSSRYDVFQHARQCISTTEDIEEVSRQYSMEHEVLLSERYPR